MFQLSADYSVVMAGNLSDLTVALSQYDICCALRLLSQICVTCQSCWFSDLVALFCPSFVVPGQDAFGSRDGGIHTR